MTPLEIGMYVLLAAFCFAIVVFVVSCVVYASKFKPQTSAESALPGLPVIGAARAAASQFGQNRRPRESTTNAHDWVWLGRATLERAACAPQQVRNACINFTNNVLPFHIYFTVSSTRMRHAGRNIFTEPSIIIATLKKYFIKIIVG
jgi:hypothetical protein